MMRYEFKKLREGFMRQQENKDAIYFSQQEAIQKVKEIGQLRRAKLYASYLLEGIENKSAMTPDMRQLLEASLTLQTTSAKALATHLQCSPATVRINFKRILTILGDHGKYPSL